MLYNNPHCGFYFFITFTNKNKIMELKDKIIESSQLLKVDDIVEGKVIILEHGNLYVDLGIYGTGIIYGIEYINARDIIKRLNVGDIILSKVILLGNDDGYVELSLKEAKQALMWKEAEEAINTNKVFELIVRDANKGGLLIDWQGVQGFLPASQLSDINYPKIDDGDKDKIIEALKRLVGQRVQMSILVANPKEGKLIFTQKNLNRQVDSINDAGSVNNTTTNVLSNHIVGEEVEGMVTGMVEFGIFIKMDDGTEGLIHKSEIAWGLVEDIKTQAKVGQRVFAKIIEIKDNKISLSIKALKENPWIQASKKYNKGDIVSGLVIRHNKHGALVSIEEGVAGLVYVSDFEDENKLRSTLSLGKIYKFEISLFEPKEQKMILKLKSDK